ncbi:Ribokinase-like protein [Blastocladiella britannica]|nr:Ribokinase-like protein [Blastocladiella britannica]
MQQPHRPLVLLVGGAYIDLVLHVPEFPAEDDKLRATKVDRRTGGNAFNTACVLAQISPPAAAVAIVSPAGTGGDDLLGPTADRLGFTYLPLTHPNHLHPTAYIIASAATKSRTIVNHATLPALDDAGLRTVLASSEHLRLDHAAWVHFEGRPNVDDIRTMIDSVRDAAPSTVRISVELERPNRPGLDSLIPLADMVVVSREYAVAHGRRPLLPESHDHAHLDPSVVDDTSSWPLEARLSLDWARSWLLPKLCPGAVAFMPMGSLGAVAVQRTRTDSGQTRLMSAYEPALAVDVVDTIGAGDAFNAGAIAALLHVMTPDATTSATAVDNQRLRLARVLRMAVGVAGRKVARDGFDGLAVNLDDLM